MLRNRSLRVGIAVLVPVLAIALWLSASDANRCDLYRNLGYVHLIKGTLSPAEEQLRASERWFSASLRAGCNAAPATFGLGHAYAGLGQEFFAISAWVAGEEPSGLRQFLVGRAYEALGQPGAAWSEYRRLPLDAAAHFNALAVRADREGNYEAALRYYATSRVINPASAKNYYGAAFVYWRRLGDDEQTAAMIRRGLAVDQRATMEATFYRGLLCYYRRDFDCAEVAWSAVIRRKPGSDAVYDLRPLAYEMLSRARLEREPLDPQEMTVAAPGWDGRYLVKRVALRARGLVGTVQ